MPAGQERLGAAIFRVADDRVADRRHVRAQLVRAAGQRLQLDPGGAVAGAVDHPPAGLRGKPVLLADMHLLAAGARLLGERRVDHRPRRHRARRRPAPNRPCAPCGRRTPWRNAPPRARSAPPAARPTYPCRAGGRAWAGRVSSGKPVQQPVEMLGRLGPALRREPRRLVEHEGVAGPRGSPCRGRTALRPSVSAFALRLRPRARAPAALRAAERGFPAPPRPGRRAPPACPPSRSCPVRAQRDTMLKLTSGMCRLNQRSSRIPSSSSSTVKVRASLTRRALSES